MLRKGKDYNRNAFVLCTREQVFKGLVLALVNAHSAAIKHQATRRKKRSFCLPVRGCNPLWQERMVAGLGGIAATVRKRARKVFFALALSVSVVLTSPAS